MVIGWKFRMNSTQMEWEIFVFLLINISNLLKKYKQKFQNWQVIFMPTKKLPP